MLRKESVEEYLSRFHPEIAELVDLKTLKLSKDSFLSPDLETFTSDIIWKCNFNNSKEETFLAFLWEHKMQEHKNYAIQAGLYIFLYLHRRVNIDKKTIEPILPLLFYHGQKPDWKPPTIHELFKGLNGFHFIKKYIPEFEPLFLNLSQKSKEEIAEIEGDFLRSAFYAFSMRHNSDLLLENISVIFDIDADNFEKHPLLVYVFSVIKKSEDEIIQKLKNSDFKNKNVVMSVLQQIEQKGIQKGRLEILDLKEKEQFNKNIDMIKMMHLEKIDPQLIARFLKIEIKFVEDVIAEKVEKLKIDALK